MVLTKNGPEFGFECASDDILGIPVKVNIDSGRKPNGVPERRRTAVGAKRRWHGDCGVSVRNRQAKLSGAKRRQVRRGLGVQGKGSLAIFSGTRLLSRTVYAFEMSLLPLGATGWVTNLALGRTVPVALFERPATRLLFGLALWNDDDRRTRHLG